MKWITIIIICLMSIGNGSYQGSLSLNVELSEVTGVWTEVDVEEHPSTRLDFNLDYDPVNNIAMLFGGSNGTLHGDTWVYHPHNETWNEVFGEGPVPMTNSETVYVPSIDKFLMYGGANGTSSYLYDMWSFDGETLTWELIEVDNVPPATRYHRMVYIPVADIILSWGGWAPGFAHPDNMWRYDVQNNTWQELDSVNKPPGRIEFSFYYEPSNDWVVMYGGQGQTGSYVDETWIYHYQTDTWEELNPMNTPFSVLGEESSADMGFFYDPNLETAFVTRNHLIWYLDYVNGSSNSTWVEIPVENNAQDYYKWRISSGMTYIYSLELFLVFGGQGEPTSTSGAEYFDRTVYLEMRSPQSSTSVTTITEDSVTNTSTLASSEVDSTQDDETSLELGYPVFVGSLILIALTIKSRKIKS